MDASTIEMVSAMIASHTSEHGVKIGRHIGMVPSCSCGKSHRSKRLSVVDSAPRAMLKNKSITSLCYYTEHSCSADGTKETKKHFLVRLSTGTFWNVILKDDVLVCFQQVFQHDVTDGILIYGGGGGAAAATHSSH